LRLLAQTVLVLQDLEEVVLSDDGNFRLSHVLQLPCARLATQDVSMNKAIGTEDGLGRRSDHPAELPDGRIELLLSWPIADGPGEREHMSFDSLGRRALAWQGQLQATHFLSELAQHSDRFVPLSPKLAVLFQPAMIH